MLKKLVYATALLLPGMALADTVSGTFRTEASETGGYLLVKFAPCPNNNEHSCGQIVRAIDGNGARIGDYEHLGKAIVWGMQDKGAGKYSGGKIWAPDTNKTYRSKMEFSGKNLKVSGCVAIICRSQLWKPAK